MLPPPLSKDSRLWPEGEVTRSTPGEETEGYRQWGRPTIVTASKNPRVRTTVTADTGAIPRILAIQQLEANNTTPVNYENLDDTLY